MTKEQMKRGIMAGIEALVEDSVDGLRTGPKEGGKGWAGWNKKLNAREARGMTREDWAKYQRPVEGCWL